MQAVSAWRPAVPGVAEVFHARFDRHAYPMHTHETWTLLIVDDGAIRYDLDRSEHGAVGTTVTLLPPDVPHDGQSATDGGFRKRVVYLDRAVLGDALIGTSAGRPEFRDPLLRTRLDQLHSVLAGPETLEAESRLAFVAERLRGHLGVPEPTGSAPPRLAAELRDLLDSRVKAGVTLQETSESLFAHPTHLVRSFTRAFGLPPHAYLMGRRIATARALLLAGRRPAEVAIEAGFFDQAHLNRHFVRHVGVSPGRYARPPGNPSAPGGHLQVWNSTTRPLDGGSKDSSTPTMRS
ncbi:MAG: AraC family transcriptional regulator [Hamadaea sp.]|uniref:helix-turn-helix domain-containing protein n=1 Tax=Hamadaea sp. TaxID=2024425 RepID=UPI0017C37C6F|nr:AraC family transcriptional regulator [Hamadaea sp.]NUR70268.1 AraC family transcriptional regulator [Hamadaea sp.]NUT18354.1 AraC family transcriptional regulator [Hamadaea sp.]